MMGKKVPFSEAVRFMREYETEAKYKQQRLGQAFFNEFFPKYLEGPDPDMFYKQNYFETRTMIFTQYVEL